MYSKGDRMEDRKSSQRIGTLKYQLVENKENRMKKV